MKNVTMFSVFIAVSAMFLSGCGAAGSGYNAISLRVGNTENGMSYSSSTGRIQGGNATEQRFYLNAPTTYAVTGVVAGYEPPPSRTANPRVGRAPLAQPSPEGFVPRYEPLDDSNGRVPPTHQPK